ncbi:Tau-tubulin kinase 2 [Clydaea vesicula]|uniref:non-specific serine/threonine protein kinase n=1 Tax=Clydaea vesicula TaxID=447962 RepID=A0AAD5TTV8_9FUNG|nr:Tau-tubulin kinase 2 [Clydaea vesicula]
MVLELLGPNLSELRRKSPVGKFSVNTTIMLAHQMLRSLEILHDNGILHRDVKPGNFCISQYNEKSKPSLLRNRPTCHLIDFGLSRRFTNSDGTIREARQKVGFRGTARYASIAAHQEVELGMVDDCWSLFYIIIEFLEGTLPWKGKEKETIGEMKIKETNENLIKNLPISMLTFYNHLKTLRYQDKPDYDLLYDCITKLNENNNYFVDSSNCYYDWELKTLEDYEEKLHSLEAEYNTAQETYLNKIDIERKVMKAESDDVELNGARESNQAYLIDNNKNSQNTLIPANSTSLTNLFSTSNGKIINMSNLKLKENQKVLNFNQLELESERFMKEKYFGDDIHKPALEYLNNFEIKENIEYFNKKQDFMDVDSPNNDAPTFNKCAMPDENLINNFNNINPVKNLDLPTWWSNTLSPTPPTGVPPFSLIQNVRARRYLKGT